MAKGLLKLKERRRITLVGPKLAKIDNGRSILEQPKI